MCRSGLDIPAPPTAIGMNRHTGIRLIESGLTVRRRFIVRRRGFITANRPTVRRRGFITVNQCDTIHRMGIMVEPIPIIGDRSSESF